MTRFPVCLAGVNCLRRESDGGVLLGTEYHPSLCKAKDTQEFALGMPVSVVRVGGFEVGEGSEVGLLWAG